MKKANRTLSNRNFFFDILKGIFIGSGFIVPGVSGGAISAIFGIYEPLINWLANITKDFLKNLKYFLPIGIGVAIGTVLFSALVELALGAYQTIMMWAFVGTIAGMFPSLWKDSGREGRSKIDIFIMFVSFIIVLVIMGLGEQLFSGSIEPGFIPWLVCGALIALGGLIPGLSPSNFILFMGLYQEMASGFRRIDLGVIIPVALGGIVTVFLLAKVIEGLFNRYYSRFYHLIIGTVLASTVMIIPTNYTNLNLMGYIWCFIAFILGAMLGLWMSRLEEKYK